MSEHSGEMLAELWNAMKPYVDKKERPDAALSFLRTAEDFVDLEECRKDLFGIDSNMDEALREIVGDEDEYEEDEEEDY